LNIRTQILLTRFAVKQLKKLPKNILAAYYTWVKTIELEGVRNTRKLSGYHDEPLKGDRKGQRSVRLNKSYRIIYEETNTGSIIIIVVQEINKHEY
jgi:proteic killer suppression protein